MAEFQKPTYVSLRLGIEEDDDVNPPAGTIVDAKNVRFSTAGAAVPRPLVGAIAATVTNAGASNSATITGSTEDFGAFFKIGETDAAAMAGTVFAYDSSSNSFAARGDYSTCLPVRKREALALLADSYGQRRFGLAVNSNGAVCVVAPQTLVNTTRIEITSSTGVPLLNRTLTDALKAAVIAIGADFVLVTQNAAAALQCRRLTVSSGVWTLGAPTTIGTLNTSTCEWDIAYGSANDFLLIHQSGVATVTLSKLTYPALAASTVTFAVTGEPGLTVYSDSTNVWVGYNNDPGATGNVTYRVYSYSALAVVLGATVVATSTDYGPLMVGPNRTANSNTAFACYAITKAASPSSRGTAIMDVTTSGVGTVYTFWHVYPLAKPGRNGRIWTVATGSPEWSEASPLGWQQSRSLLLRFTAPSGPSSITTPIIELATDSFEGTPITSKITCLVPEVYSSTSTFALIQDTLFAPGSSRPVRLQVFEYETSDVKPWRSTVQCGSTTVIAGQPVELGAQGATNTATANIVRPSGVPIGFAHPPAILAATQGTTGSLTATNAYTWVAVFEWIDPETGRLHRSEPSPPYTTTLTGVNDDVTLTIAGLMVDPRCIDAASAPTVVVYRTRGNEQQLRKEVTYLTAQSCFAETITHVSTIADGDLGDFLYTEGGAVAYNLAPSARYVRRTEGAVLFGGLWDRRLLRQSRDFVPGEPVQSSDLGSWDIYLPEDCNGIAYQDGLRYAFSKTAVYIVTGDGPDDKGQGGFDPVRTLTNEVGCIAEASILETSAGIFFLSARGFMLIPRGGGVPRFVGRGVRKSIANYLTFSGGTCLASAVVTGDTNTARFLMFDGLSVTKVFVYDLDTGAWEYDTYRDTNGGAEADTRLSTIGAWNIRATTNGFIAAHARGDIGSSRCAVIERPGLFFSSDNATVTSYIKFADMRPFGLAGWGRFQTVAFVMSELVADSGISSVTGTVTPDGLSSSAVSRTWASLANPGITQTIYRGIDCGHMQGTGVVVEWTSVRAGESTLAIGPSLNGLAMLTVPEKGLRLLQPSER